MNGNPVQQSGFVTAGHLAVFAGNGVVQDGGPILASEKVLGTLFSANFNAASVDQPILMPYSVTVFTITRIIVTNASPAISSAVGGFYTAASQGGSAIVANSQAYSSLTNSNLLLNATIASYGQTARFSNANLTTTLGPNNQSTLEIFFNLSTPNGSPVNADIYVIGIDLSPPA